MDEEQRILLGHRVGYGKPVNGEANHESLTILSMLVWHMVANESKPKIIPS